MTSADIVSNSRDSPVGTREIALVDLLDRLLAGGVVVTGDVTISLAGVDLVRISLRAIISSIQESTCVALEAGNDG